MARRDVLHGPENPPPPTPTPLFPALPTGWLCSYEEASPKMKRRVEAVGSPAAPWRAALRDAQDDLVFNLRGLPQSVQASFGARPGGPGRQKLRCVGKGGQPVPRLPWNVTPAAAAVVPRAAAPGASLAFAACSLLAAAL